MAAAMYAGVPDRSSVTQFREQGFDVADGAAIDDATSEIWAAVDKGKVEPFVNSAKSQMPLRVPADITPTKNQDCSRADKYRSQADACNPTSLACRLAGESPCFWLSRRTPDTAGAALPIPPLPRE